jgi:hypothetical protein
VAIDVFLSQQSVGNSHELQISGGASDYRGNSPRCDTTSMTARP